MADTVGARPLACAGAKEEKKQEKPFPLAHSHRSHFLKDRISTHTSSYIVEKQKGSFSCSSNGRLSVSGFGRAVLQLRSRS